MCSGFADAWFVIWLWGFAVLVNFGYCIGYGFVVWCLAVWLCYGWFGLVFAWVIWWCLCWLL